MSDRQTGREQAGEERQGRRTEAGLAGTGGSDPARRRRNLLLNHFIAYFAVLIILVPVNHAVSPEQPWFLFVMVAWGVPLALHVAHVMGLFGATRD